MVRRHSPTAILVFSPISFAQRLTPTESLWTIKTESSSLLRKVSNYTCLERISTLSYPGRFSPKQPSPEQTEFEIALVDGRELYSGSGGSPFGASPPASLDPAFATTGLYSSLARGLISEEAAGESLVEETVIDHQPMLRYRFEFSPQTAPWNISFNHKTAVAGQEGTFRASTADRLLRHVTVDAVSISPDIGLKHVHLDVDYLSVSISNQRSLLPALVHLTALERNGTTHLSRIRFANCRAFTAQSTLSFDR